MAPNRRSSVAPVLFVLSLAFAACARAPEEAPKPTGPPKEGGPPTLQQEVTVHVTLDTSKPDAKPMPSIDPVRLSHGKGQFANWVLDGDGDLKITMKDEDPFERPIVNEGKHSRSAKPKKEAIGKTFRYTIIVTVNGKPYPNDPDVEIQP